MSSVIITMALGGWIYSPTRHHLGTNILSCLRRFPVAPTRVIDINIHLAPSLWFGPGKARSSIKLTFRELWWDVREGQASSGRLSQTSGGLRASHLAKDGNHHHGACETAAAASACSHKGLI